MVILNLFQDLKRFRNKFGMTDISIMNDKPTTNHQFVSRGGIKLQAALDQFEVDVKGLVVLDVGSSTGGFVDCLLQNGAEKVYSVDTAYGELAWKIRNNPKVVVLERTNILHLEKLPEKVDLVTIDAGWTKLELVLSIIRKFLKPEGVIIALLKPHYEAEKHQLEHGIVKEGQVSSIKGQVLEKIKDSGFKIKDELESPILGGGGKGNREFLIYLSL